MIADFNTAQGDKVDFSRLLGGDTSMLSTQDDGAGNTKLVVTANAASYYEGVEVSVVMQGVAYTGFDLHAWINASRILVA